MEINLKELRELTEAISPLTQSADQSQLLQLMLENFFLRIEKRFDELDKKIDALQELKTSKKGVNYVNNTTSNSTKQEVEVDTNYSTEEIEVSSPALDVMKRANAPVPGYIIFREDNREELPSRDYPFSFGVHAEINGVRYFISEAWKEYLDELGDRVEFESVIEFFEFIEDPARKLNLEDFNLIDKVSLYNCPWKFPSSKPENYFKDHGDVNNIWTSYYWEQKEEGIYYVNQGSYVATNRYAENKKFHTFFTGDENQYGTTANPACLILREDETFQISFNSFHYELCADNAYELPLSKRPRAVRQGANYTALQPTPNLNNWFRDICNQRSHIVLFAWGWDNLKKSKGRYFFQLMDRFSEKMRQMAGNPKEKKKLGIKKEDFQKEFVNWFSLPDVADAAAKYSTIKPTNDQELEQILYYPSKLTKPVEEEYRLCYGSGLRTWDILPPSYEYLWLDGETPRDMQNFSIEFKEEGVRNLLNKIKIDVVLPFYHDKVNQCWYELLKMKGISREEWKALWGTSSDPGSHNKDKTPSTDLFYRNSGSKYPNGVYFTYQEKRRKITKDRILAKVPLPVIDFKHLRLEGV